MHEGFAKRHDIENLTVLVTDLVEEAQAADLIFLRRRSEGEAMLCSTSALATSRFTKSIGTSTGRCWPLPLRLK